MGCAVAIRALKVIEEEQMEEKAEKLGHVFRAGLKAIKSPMIQTVRGVGLLNAVVIDESETGGQSTWDLCMLLREQGLLVSFLTLEKQKRTRNEVYGC